MHSRNKAVVCFNILNVCFVVHDGVTFMLPWNQKKAKQLCMFQVNKEEKQSIYIGKNSKFENCFVIVPSTETKRINLYLPSTKLLLVFQLISQFKAQNSPATH